MGVLSHPSPRLTILLASTNQVSSPRPSVLSIQLPLGAPSAALSGRQSHDVHQHFSQPSLGIVPEKRFVLAPCQQSPGSTLLSDAQPWASPTHPGGPQVPREPCSHCPLYHNLQGWGGRWGDSGCCLSSHRHVGCHAEPDDWV